MKNTGTTKWTSSAGYKLGSQNPAGNITWGIRTVALPKNVAPGASVTFSFKVTAPSVIGSYNFQWQMMKGTQSFGQTSTSIIVQVKR